MQKCGLIGGIGPESTINYYALINRLFQERTHSVASAPIFINSIDLPTMIAFIQDDAKEALIDYLATAVEECALAGTVFAALAACTPHIVFEELQQRCSIPLLSIVDVTRDRAAKLGVTRAGILGTRFTMQGQFFPKVFASEGISIVQPSPTEQEYIHDKYFSELAKGVLKAETRTELIRIINDLKNREAIDAIVLGGTELSLAFTGESICGIPLLDTTAIHVEAIIERILSGDRPEVNCRELHRTE